MKCLLPINRAALLALVAPLALTAADGPSLEERMHALESRVNTLEHENADLRGRLGAAAVGPAASAVGPGGREARLVIGGFTQAQAEFGGAGDQRFAGTADRIYFRRARLYLLAHFAENFDAKIEGEFGSGSVTAATGLRAQANDTYLNWSRFPAANIRIGQLKPAYSAELMGTEFKGPMVERSLGAERIGDGRQLGVSVLGEGWAQRAGYLMMIGNGNGSNSSANDNRKFHQTARVYATAFDDKHAGKLVLGADALHTIDTAVAKPGFGFDSVPGGAIDNLFTGTRDGWGVDAAWHGGPLELSSELLRMRFRATDRIPQSSFDAESWQLTAACFLVPHQLQVAVRREHFDPNLAHAGDSTDNWMVGLDYYLKGDDIRFIVDYLFGHAAGLANGHGRLITRFQIVY